MDCYRPELPPYPCTAHNRPVLPARLLAAARRAIRRHRASPVGFIALLLILRAATPLGLQALPSDSTSAPAGAIQVFNPDRAPARSPADIAAEIIAAETAIYALRTASPITFKSDSTAPEIIPELAIQRLRLELGQKIQAISGPDSTFYQPFAGLRSGAHDESSAGPVHRMQEALLRWNNKLPLKTNGHYDEATIKSLTLFKLVYDLGHDGSFVDQATAGYLLAIEEGNDQELAEPQGFTGRLVYHAAQFLGLRYRLGGDGKKTTDCGMLTRMAMISAGLVDEVFNRVAATQYKYAEEGKMGLTLVDKNEEPAPGDLVFFKWNTRRARHRYKGITHVGIFLGKVGESLYVLEAASARKTRKVTILDRSNSIRKIAGYARFTAPPEDGPIEPALEMTD